MPRDNHESRRVGIYFGPSSYTRLTKEEVAEFIKHEMGLIRSDGGPKWTEGLTSLIESGMNEWDRAPEVDESELKESINEIEERIKDYHEDVRQLSQEQESEESIDYIQAAERVHCLEERILEVLCREENIGAKSSNYVRIHNLAREIDVDYPIVYKFVENLAEDSCCNLVEMDLQREQVKAAKADAIEIHRNRMVKD